MALERFEMRIDSELLERLDNWRSNEDDTPSRAEAIRRLLEAGLAHDKRGRPPQLSDGEKLIATLLAEFIEKSGVEVDNDVSLVQKTIAGGHYWALGWEMPHVFHGHADKQRHVSFVVDVLDMWRFLEEDYERYGEDQKAELASKIAPFNTVRFSGFDGNEEDEYGIAVFLVRDLKRFSRFGEDGRSLNSHCHMVEKYRSMLRIFEPIRKTLELGKRMNVDQMAEIINARR
jgi:uncharacterized protein YfbU (UPF0304 family)